MGGGLKELQDHRGLQALLACRLQVQVARGCIGLQEVTVGYQRLPALLACRLQVKAIRSHRVTNGSK